MNREKKLALNTLIIAIGKICTQLVSFFLLPLYTAVLSTTEYGIVDLVNTLVGLFLPILMLQIDQGVFRELLENRDRMKEKTKIISTAVIFILLICIFAVFVFSFIFLFIDNIYKWYLLFNILFIALPTLFLQIARGTDKNLEYSIGSFLIASSTIIFNVLFILFLNLRVEGMLLSSILGQFIGTLYLFFKLKLWKYIKISFFDINICKNLIKYSLPLIPNAISWWIFNASDRIIVSFILGISFTGILSAANKFSALFISAYSIIYLSFTESIALNINSDDISDFFNKTFSTLLKIFASCALGIIAIVPFVYTLLLNVKFISGYGLVPILMVAAIFNVIVGLLGSVYVAKKKTDEIAKTSIMSAVMNIIINLLLIKFIGLYAAAISTFVSYFIMTIYRIFDINKKYFSIKFNKHTIFIFTLMFSFVIFTYYINNLMLNIFTLILVILFSIYLNFDIIKITFLFICKKVKK